MHTLRVRPHAFFVYGIMHFYAETLMQALSTVHVHGCICNFFIEINSIFITHNINSEISYLVHVIAHTEFWIKFGIKIGLDVECDPVLI